jgi:hypothetical protein
VVVGDLAVRFDPNLLELCGAHSERLTHASDALATEA